MLLRVFTVLAVLVASISSNAAVSLTVDGAVEYQTIMGGGTAFGGGGQSFDDLTYYPIPLRDVAAQTYALGYRLIRSDIESSGSCYPEVNNDDGDPFHYNWDNGKNSFNPKFPRG